MKYCKKCKVKVADDSKICPLCQYSLSDTADKSDAVYPFISLAYSKKKLYIKLGIFASIVGMIITSIIDIIINGHLTWSWYVIGGVFTSWILFGIALSKLKNLPKNILYQAITCTILAVIWDKLTGGHGWSLIYVIPFLCAGTNIGLITVFFLFRLKVDDVAFYYFINLLYGFLPMLFILTHKATVLYPSLISIGVSAISLAAFLIFYWANILEVLKSKFHF